jgi:hypothetical protein
MNMINRFYILQVALIYTFHDDRAFSFKTVSLFSSFMGKGHIIITVTLVFTLFSNHCFARIENWKEN